MRDRICEYVRTSKTLPALPESLSRLMALTGDPRSGVADAVQVLRRDPGVAAQVLKVANSAALGARTAFSSVETAAAHLGLQRIAEIGMSHAAVRLFDLAKLPFDARSFWRRSIACATLAQALCRMMPARAEAGPQPSPADCFTAGLVHDLGILVLVHAFPEASAGVMTAAREQGRPLLVEERETLGIDHQEIGGLLCERWKLAPSLTWSARAHHHPHNAPAEQRTIVAFVHVANHISIGRGFGYEGEVTDAHIAPTAWDHLRLDLERAPEIIAQAEAALSKAEMLL